MEQRRSVIARRMSPTLVDLRSQAHLLEVKIALDAPQCFVVDVALIPQIEDGVALDA
jgi:hypothetical protein